MTTIPLDKAQHELAGLFDRVTRTRRRVKIRGKDNCAYLISQEELDGFQTTPEPGAVPGTIERAPKGKSTPCGECVAPEWKLPEPTPLGEFLAPVEKWRELANE